MENLRNQQLIEEREIYENNFISIEDIMKSDELDYYTCPKFEEYFLEDFVCEDTMNELDLEFDFEDYLINLRDEQLIEQREAYEEKYFSVPDEIPDVDLMDLQIESFERYGYAPEYDYYDVDYNYVEECFPDYGDDYYFEEYNMDAAYCGGRMYGYIVDDNESFEEFDYPEGPDENLSGFRFPEPCYQDVFYDQCFEFPDDFYDCPEVDYSFEDLMGFDLYEREESHMQSLIAQHLEEEKQFMKFIAGGEVENEYFPPEAQEDMIIILN